MMETFEEIRDKCNNRRREIGCSPDSLRYECYHNVDSTGLCREERCPKLKKEPSGMNIAEAMKAYVEGKRIRRKAWTDKALVLCKNGCVPFNITINDYDFTATDWEIVVECFDFGEALKRMKLGKRVNRKSWSHYNSITILNGEICGLGNYAFSVDTHSMLSEDWYEAT